MKFFVDHLKVNSKASNPFLKTLLEKKKKQQTLLSSS